ncbi:MAG TPA: hypothetical protein VEJ16_09275 [Alphaproteobacteria bacterium]|nr:hypothetical protein [Alphaproteobacteria bacterium]
MRELLRSAALAFSAGAIGGLVNRGALVLLGVMGLMDHPDISKEWLYQAITWGGLWGFLFLIPWGAPWWLRGLVFGLGPSAGVWFVIYPFSLGAGVFGLDWGFTAALIPLIANSAWGIAASGWLGILGERRATG